MIVITKIYQSTSTESFYVLPDNSTNASCPSHPCATLSQYILNTSGMSNISFLFLSGKHSLFSTITFKQVYNVTMIGVSYNNSAPAVVICNSAEAVVVFINATNIKIANLLFENCGGIGPKIIPRNDIYPDDYYPLPAALFFDTCYYCNVTNTTFIGYGLMMNNLLGESYLDSITILLAVEYGLLQKCNQGMRIMNTGKAKHPINLEPIDSNITLTLSDSNFIGISVQPVLLIGLFHGISSRITFRIKIVSFITINFKELHIK